METVRIESPMMAEWDQIVEEAVRKAKGMQNSETACDAQFELWMQKAHRVTFHNLLLEKVFRSVMKQGIFINKMPKMFLHLRI